jgi:hypothetical protein
MLCSLILLDDSFQIPLKGKVAEQLSIGVLACFLAACQKTWVITKSRRHGTEAVNKTLQG